jgi:hypothetical protein
VVSSRPETIVAMRGTPPGPDVMARASVVGGSVKERRKSTECPLRISQMCWSPKLDDIRVDAFHTRVTSSTPAGSVLSNPSTTLSKKTSSLLAYQMKKIYIFEKVAAIL